MNFKFFEHLNLPIAVIDNFYDDSTCQKIWQELCFLNNDSDKLLPPSQTGSAYDMVDGEKVFKKQNRGIFLDHIYTNRSISNILTANRKTFSSSIIDKLTNIHCFFQYLGGTNFDKTLVQYYENEDYYDYHKDQSLITTIYWTYKLPKKFVGGNFQFENGPNIECINNRMIIFPSILNHSVEKTFLDAKFKNQNYGRFSISQFTTITI